MANVCVHWEDALNVAAKAVIRVIKVCISTVLIKEGGELEKMLLPFKLGLGGVFGSGEQYMSWVSIDYAMAMIQYVMTNYSLQGPVNFVTPNAINDRKFSKSLGQVLSRPTIFPLPAFASRIASGEMANELLLSSNRVYPSKLMEIGYKFLHPELNQALNNLK